MDYCIANDFESRFYKITENFNDQLRKIKTEFGTKLKSSKETLHLTTINFNWEIKNVTSELQKVKRELESSKTSLEQLQRENALLKENLENTSKNHDNIMTKIDSFAHYSSQEEIFFDYGLGNSMTSSGWEIVKFDRPRAVSTTKIYDDTTGKVTIEEGGLYYFYTHGLPLEKSDWFSLYIYVDDERACQASKNDGTSAHMSCAIVRKLKSGQQIYVKKYNGLFGHSDPYTGFVGFKLQ